MEEIGFVYSLQEVSPHKCGSLCVLVCMLENLTLRVCADNWAKSSGSLSTLSAGKRGGSIVFGYLNNSYQSVRCHW